MQTIIEPSEARTTVAAGNSHSKPTTKPTAPSIGSILQTGLGFLASKTLLSAAELGAFTELAAGPLDVETLRHRLGLHERAARDFFERWWR
jgi:hypothetical protein